MENQLILTESNYQNNPNLKIFEHFLKETIITSKNKIKGSHMPLSESADKIKTILLVRKVFHIVSEGNYLFLIIGKSKQKPSSKSYYLMAQLAAQSSDLLVRIAEKFAKTNGLRLVQYSLMPKTFRVGLFALKIINTAEEYSKAIALLEQFRAEFQLNLKKISNLMGNE